VKHIDGIGELGNVDDPERSGCIPNPNFFTPCPTVFMGFQSSGSWPF
jgi:hypothetical protein